MTGKELGAQPASSSVESFHPTTVGNQPIQRHKTHLGLTKREQFSAMIMQAIMYDPASAMTMSFPKVAELAISAADALLEELAK